MTVPYWFLFLAAICIGVRSLFGTVALIDRCMRRHKLGVVVVPASGEFGNSAGDGAGTFNDLGPRLTTTHGLWREPGGSTRGSLPNTQSGRTGGRE